MTRSNHSQSFRSDIFGASGHTFFSFQPSHKLHTRHPFETNQSPAERFKMRSLFCLATATLVSATAFQVFVFAPNKNPDGAILHAAQNGFATQLDGPSTYCPLKPADSCPKVVGTLVSQDMEAMAVRIDVLTHQADQFPLS